jgi:hypothetical protein
MPAPFFVETLGICSGREWLGRGFHAFRVNFTRAEDELPLCCGFHLVEKLMLDGSGGSLSALACIRQDVPPLIHNAIGLHKHTL